MITHEARRMLRAHRYGALATLSLKFDGYPFGSIMPYLTGHDGSPLILISSLAEHTKNILRDPRVSLITHDQRTPHIQAQGRVTLIGNARQEPDRGKFAARHLRYFPEAQVYFTMHDFSFYRIEPIAVRYIGGFGKIHWIDMDKYAVTPAEAFAAQEEALLVGINMRQQTALRQMLLSQHNIDGADVQAIGLDCDGLDLRSNGQVWRLDFPEMISSPSPNALIEMLTRTAR